MSFQGPVLIIGIGGAGTRLAYQARQALDADVLAVSNDAGDLRSGPSVHVSTGSVINPSVHLVRGSAYGASEQIASEISRYSTIVMMANLAGKAGSAISPVIADICGEQGKDLVSFAIMPFRYEKERIFSSGIALRRIREGSRCTIVLDNDALLEGNPDLTPKECYDIANSAVMHVAGALCTSGITDDNILSTGRDGRHVEESLRDSLKMLYSGTAPGTVKSSIMLVTGGDDVPVRVLDAVSSLTAGITGSSARIDTPSSDESRVVMLSSVQQMTKFDRYDPLAAIPQEDTLDWSAPERSIGCSLDIPQLE